VEYSGYVAAGYAAKLMADLGADVIKVEPPEGDPSRRRGPFPPGREDDPNASGLFIFLNTNKRGVTLDLSFEEDRAKLFTLLADADVFVHSSSLREARRLGIREEELRERCPRVIHTWITTFGLTGPHAEYEADEITAMAAGGWLSMSPGNAPSLEHPPLKPFGRQADYQAGTTAALATMGALFAREETGAGQLVDISAQEVVGTEVEVALAHWTHGHTLQTHAARVRGVGNALRCQDGYIHATFTPAQRWLAFAELMGNPEWARDPAFTEPGGLDERWSELQPLIEEWTSQYTVEELLKRTAQARLPFAPISTVDWLVSSPHLKERDFFRSTSQPEVGDVTIPGPPYAFGRTPWQLRRPAPRLGEHNAELLATAKGSA
jgi:crotonobetainyl-CoA:carnitine CoA-transferase CaiB-like acyl-CoA transferase